MIITPIKQKINLPSPLKLEETVEGKIIGIGRSSVFINLGIQGTGIIYGKEFYEAKSELENLKKGDKVFAKIIDLENENGYIELSLSKANKEIIWEELRQKKENKETVKVKILGANKGGLLAEFKRVAAFLPASQLSLSHYSELQKGEQKDILRELQKFIGKEMEVKISELMPKQEKIILSEKAKELENIEKLLRNYKVGDIVEGKISKIVNFGAFLRFFLSPPAKEKNKTEDKDEKEQKTQEQEIEGLIHISEFDWQLIENPNEILKSGQTVKAKIIKLNEGRVFLSLKALKKDPWEDIEKKYKKEDIVKGKVVKLNPFGALIQIPSKIQALCHISEFGTKKKMEEKLKIAKNYDFQILSIEPKEHKMLLKLKP